MAMFCLTSAFIVIGLTLKVAHREWQDVTMETLHKLRDLIACKVRLRHACISSPISSLSSLIVNRITTLNFIYDIFRKKQSLRHRSSYSQNVHQHQHQHQHHHQQHYHHQSKIYHHPKYSASSIMWSMPTSSGALPRINTKTFRNKFLRRSLRKDFSRFGRPLRQHHLMRVITEQN
mmetsp:Transcript_18262/g.25675  ORF Transcript_18262/g.25675 Transcript_18262/m.25675 type:complete len:176 (-) Transcript_18262:343-870(-)